MRKWIVIGGAALVLAVVVILALMRAAEKRKQTERFAARREIEVAVEVANPAEDFPGQRGLYDRGHGILQDIR
jgi:hypothetical protein